MHEENNVISFHGSYARGRALSSCFLPAKRIASHVSHGRLADDKRFPQQQRKIPVIMLTAHAMQEDREKGFEAGCDDFMTKPIDEALLLSTVERYIAREQ